MKPFKSVLMVILAASSGTLSAATDVWTSLGPGGGEIERLVVDPQRPSILYAVAGGGVFKTVNGGITWSLAISAVSSGGVRDLVIHPQNPNTLYAVGGPRGLRSTDGGISWRSLNLPDSLPARTYTLAVDPRSGALYARTCSGIARSTDGGESWVEVVFPPPLYCFAPLAVDPSTGALYTTRTSDTAGGSVSERSGRIFKSEDGAETWSVLELGVTSVAVVALGIDPQNSNTIYALAGGSIAPAEHHYGAWLFKTNDGGISWIVSTQLGAGGRGAVAVDPQNPNTIYVATRSSVLRSMDGGTNWKPLALAEGPQWFWSPSSVTALAIAPLASPAERSSTVYAGTYTRGVWKSADQGETWTDINSGLTANNIQSLVLDPQNPGTLYGVQGGVEIVKTSDGGMTWRSSDSGLPRDAFLGPLAIDPQNPARVYTATGWQGVFRTTDGGASWEAANYGLPGAVNGLTIDPQNTSTLYAGIGDDSCWEYGRCFSSGVFKSTDGGASWSYSGLSGYWVGRVVVAPLNSNVIYAVGFLPRSAGVLPPSAGVASEAWYWGFPAFFKSTNGGASWDVFKLPIPSFGLAINPQEPNTAYVYGDIFKTNDGGESWNAVDLLSVRALAIDPQTPSTLYAGTGNGVFRSTDGGASWSAVNSGLTSLAIDSLAIDPQNPSKVFAGTSGGGVFSITFTSQSTPRE